MEIICVSQIDCTFIILNLGCIVCKYDSILWIISVDLWRAAHLRHIPAFSQVISLFTWAWNLVDNLSSGEVSRLLAMYVLNSFIQEARFSLLILDMLLKFTAFWGSLESTVIETSSCTFNFCKLKLFEFLFRKMKVIWPHDKQLFFRHCYQWARVHIR